MKLASSILGMMLILFKFKFSSNNFMNLNPLTIHISNFGESFIFVCLECAQLVGNVVKLCHYIYELILVACRHIFGAICNVENVYNISELFHN